MSLIDTIRRVRRTPLRAPGDGGGGPKVALAGQRVLLVYLFPALGDAILIAPVAKALLNGGAEKVTLLVRKNAARILATLDLPIELLVLPDALARSGAELKAARGELKQATRQFEQKLQKKRFGVAVDLTFRADADGRRWVEATEAPVRLGWCASTEDPADTGLTHATPDVRHHADRHWSRLMVLPLSALSVDRPDYQLPFVQDRAAQKEALALYGKGPKRVLLIPGARQEQRRFPAEGFVEIGRTAIEGHRAQVVVAGAPDEAKLLKSIQKSLGDAATVYSKKDLSTLVALVQSADVVVSNDTGPMHLAFLLDRPTIALFTVMSPLCWGPPAPGPRAIVLNANGHSLDPVRAGMYTRAVIQDLGRLLTRA